MSARLALAAVAVVLGFGVLAALLIPNPGSNAHPTHRVVAVAPAARVVEHPAHAGGTAVSSTIDASTDRAFLADLFDGAATDLDPQTAADLITTAHRMCDTPQTRADWLAALTAPGPHALTGGEASHLYDSATAAYCPEHLAEAFAG